ncbi:Lar family restriction alleviation protein [Desulfovibrio sp. OttesenSCG-928-A18]|nr:Lar family restriction alleviation protein [Desulfovibrio sp. OttesenSCG-928-A18]
MPTPELLPCPFCGSTSLDAHRGYTEIATYQISCMNMGCECSTALWSKPEEAIDAWNRRAPGWTRIEDCPEEWKDGRLCVLKFIGSSILLARFKYCEFYEKEVWEDTTGRVVFNPDFVIPLPAGPEK